MMMNDNLREDASIGGGGSIDDSDASGVDAILKDLEAWSEGVNPDTFLSWCALGEGAREREGGVFCGTSTSSAKRSHMMQ